MKGQLRVAFAGGGTGGHVFPALNMANAIKNEWQADFLFFGTQRGLEHIKIPEAGYPLEYIPAAGFQRRITVKNLSFPWKLYKSMRISKTKLNEFNPHLVIGTGGYVMGPVLKSAQKLGIPTILQEQNSFPGVSTRLLAKKAKLIFLAYPEAKEFLQTQAKVLVTGNPIYTEAVEESREALQQAFHLEEDKKVILIFGGSQGAASINQAIKEMLLADGLPKGYQLLWQTGMNEIDAAHHFIAENNIRFVQPFPFINGMQRAYAVADFAVCRAGAMTLSELAAAGLPSVLVPYPFAAGDHQTKNAQALESRKAAIVVNDDADLSKNLSRIVFELAEDEPKRRMMSARSAGMHHADTYKQMIAAIKRLLEGNVN